jgi:hypothetical protein
MHSNNVQLQAGRSDYLPPAIEKGEDQEIDQKKCFENIP